MLVNGVTSQLNIFKQLTLVWFCHHVQPSSLSGSCAKHHGIEYARTTGNLLPRGGTLWISGFIAKSKSFNAPSEMRSHCAAWSCDKVWGIRIGKKGLCHCMQLAHFNVILGQFVQSKLHLTEGGIACCFSSPGAHQGSIDWMQWFMLNIWTHLATETTDWSGHGSVVRKYLVLPLVKPANKAVAPPWSDSYALLQLISDLITVSVSAFKISIELFSLLSWYIAFTLPLGSRDTPVRGRSGGHGF